MPTAKPFEAGEFGLPRPACLGGRLVGEHLSRGRVDAALAQRGGDPCLLESRIGEISVRSDVRERALRALDGLRERGRRVERRVVEDPLAVGRLAGTAVVLQRPGRGLRRKVPEETEYVSLRHPVGGPVGGTPEVGERAAGPEAPDGVHRPAGLAREVGAPAESVAHETHGIGGKVGERLQECVDLALGGALHVIELVFEFRKLAGHRPDLADLVRDLRDLVRDDRGPLEPAAEVELRARGGRVRER